MRGLRKALLPAALCLTLGASSCLGPNNAFDRLNAWNHEVTDNKWANEGIFLGLNIIPVYAIAYLGDIIIFNSIEFWGGDNPIDPPVGG